MKPILILIVVLFTLKVPAQEAKLKEPETVAALQQRISELVANPRYNAALWGVKIVSLESGKVLFSTNAEKLFSPASNSKLYSMALALDKLGADYRIKTSLYARTRPDADGTLSGDLVVYGRGDPTFNGSPEKAFGPLVAAITNAGVKKIEGDIVGDDSYFHSAPYGSGWDWEDLENYYGAEISTLTYNSNLVQLVVKPGDALGEPAKLTFSPPTTYITVSNRTHTVAKGGRRSINIQRPLGENVIYVTGTVPLEDAGGTPEDETMHDPAALFAAFLKEQLERNGVTVTGKSRSVHWTEREVAPLKLSEWVEIGLVQSLPLRDILRLVQKPSHNLYTDLIFEHIGASDLTANPGLTAEEGGVRELNTFLQKVGIKRGDTIFEEGSGLSRDNLTTPNATVTLLTYMSKHKDAEAYINALPIAGVDGTLRRRMKGTAAEGNVRAKTGTLRWAHSMSGYVTTAAGERLVFSMMLNRYQSAERDRSKTQDLDAIAEMLAGFKVKTDKTTE